MMKLSPIQLLDYHVTSLTVEASSSFQRDKPMDLDPVDLQISASSKLLSDGDDPRWAVTLSLRHEPVEGKNIPYRLVIELVGLVSTVMKKIDEGVNHAVEVNGPSMLFGAAREILREATARGPHGSIIIPSASFFTVPPDSNTSAKMSPKTVGKGTKRSK